MKHHSTAPLRSIAPIRLTFSVISIGFSIVLALAAFGASVNTTWTYQGQLRRIGSAYTGTCNFQFSLWNAASGGTQQGSTQSISAVTVANGVFTVVLDFGDLLTGDARWLATSVQCSGDSAFTALDPRQALTAEPYALSLRPGAQINGSSDFGAMLSGNNSGVGFGILGSGKIGLYGSTNSTSGQGVYGQATGASAAGVFGLNTSGPGIWGRSTGAGSAIFGESNSTGYGVQGKGSGANAAIFGENTGAGYGVTGKGSVGVSGQPSGDNGTGVYGDAQNVTGGYGVVGRGATGLYGESTGASGTIGVRGVASGTNSVGVYGSATGTNTAGVFGSTNNNGTGGVNSPAIWAQSSGNSAALYAEALSNGWAGFFHGSAYVSGNLVVNGVLTKSSGSFKIDHPLDPEHKFLSHSFVESPDMMNIYNGNVTTDATGTATVTLPAYFAALNRDFRYQLTVMGQFAQAIVSREIIADNTFAIRTDKPGIKVSWQVTGIRQDVYARGNPIVVEQAKSAEEDGKYLYPAGFGAGEEKRIGHSNAPDRSSAGPSDPASK